jgi:hypothetical protein
MGAFYAPRAGEGTQILHVKSSKSVESIRGHSTPVRPPASSNGHAPEADVTAGTETPEVPEPPAPPAVIPTDAGLPCSGQTIRTLKPAQLAMLVSKVARLVHDDGDRWVPLLAALQAERASRLARGQRRTAPPATMAVASEPVL